MKKVLKNTQISYITISKDDSNLNELYGVILDYNEPKLMDKYDPMYKQSVSIMIPKSQTLNPTYNRLNFYSATKEGLLNLEKSDEIIYIAKFQPDTTEKAFISNEQSVWVVKKRNGVLKKSRNHLSMGSKVTYNNFICDRLKYWFDNGRDIPVNYSNYFNRPITNTEDLKKGHHINFIGQVVSYWPITSKNIPMTNLLLTDYTVNKKPVTLTTRKGKDYSIEKNYLLQCTLFDENANGCPDLSFGDYIYITNAECKLSKNNALELVLHGERNTLPRIRILNEDDNIIRDLKKRKSLYETRNKRLSGSNEDISIKIQKKNNDDSSIEISNKHSVYTKCNQTPSKYSTITEVIHGQKEVKYFLHGNIVDYKPKDISEISRNFCKQCDQSFHHEIESCSACKNTNLILIHRCMFLFKDENGDSLILGAVGTEEHPLFHNIPMLNITENEDIKQDIHNRLEALCKLDENKNQLNFELCVMGFQYHDESKYTITDTEIYSE